MEHTQKTRVMANYGNRFISVYHANLKAFEKGTWKSECPVCEDGLLLVERSPDNADLQEFDRCCICAQQFRYVDILTMIARDQSGLPPIRNAKPDS